MEYFDLGIIGGGPAGYTAAMYYKKLGKSVVLFEKDELGGTCLNRGCIPTKAFLHIADLYFELQGANNLGINFDNLSIDFDKIKEYKTNVVSKLRKGLELTLKNAGVNVIKESAEIFEKDIIKTDSCEYKCEQIIIATGSIPKEIKGLEYDHKFILSSDDILELDKLPKSILIIGSGAIGIEWARILSSFGVKVTIVELMDRLCPLADWEVSKRLERQFKMKKIKTCLSTSVNKINGNVVELSNGETIEPECVLVAVGRVVNKGINEGVNEGVNKNKYTVIGDASAEIMLAHYAVSQAKGLVFDIPFNKKTVPSVIYGTPEIAWIGEVSKSKEDDENYDKHFLLISALGKSHCDNNIDGFIKILSNDGEIKGASIVSKEASALIQQIAIAMDNDVSLEDLKKTCFAHPTYSEGIQDAIMSK